MAKFVWILSWLLLAIAFLAGPFSLYLAACGRFWKSVGTIILGIMIGVSGLFLSLIAAKMRYQELEEAGNKITNDMFGYGQVLVGGLGLIYFLGVFVVTLIITAFRFFQTWRQV